KMSKDDVKQEHKDLEGDPQMKTRRREMQSEIQSGSLAQSVKHNQALIVREGHICDIVPETQLPVSGDNIHDMQGRLVTPGLID
ncbi:EscU/YscU/HrcU family type III secretion system export apparatus switch protein, partial [Salmonella enterica subsp. enterica serovar Kentucky]|nr:EscU/YscU/HrcU family type III secretion system export apparatus switch protein [Salmonella enterica subsp. enterica serovar Kentucky]